MEPSDVQEDPAPDVRAQADALLGARNRRALIEDFLRRGFRRDGVTRLSNVAIAHRVGCLPSQVAAVRAELVAGGEEVGLS